MGETIGEAIGADHQSFDEYYDNIKNASGDAERVRWRNQLTWTLARHAISEELTLYPAMEQWLGEEGVELSKSDKEQHAGVKKELSDLQDMSPTSPEFWPKLDALMKVLHYHIEHERTEDMPRLEKVMPRSQSEELARQFQRTKNIVPSRSHPSAPTEYYLESLTALMATPIDRFQDWLRDFPSEDSIERSRAAHAAS